MEWIDSTDRLAEVVPAVGPGPLAVDLEADSFHHFREKVCLLQLAFAGRDLLVDPLAGVSLEPLRAVLAGREVRKVLHGADYDLRLLGRDHGLAMAGVFDTMIAARLTGERAFGLAALLAKHLGVDLDKSHQRADWSLRPLPAAMAAYAVADTRHLVALAERLEEKLSALGRLAWADEEFRKLEAVRWSDTPDPEPWRRIKGATVLDRRGLAVLREVAVAREALGRARDLPLFRVLRDEAALEVARRRPGTREELVEVPGIPRPFLSGEPLRLLLAAVARGGALAEAELPEIRRGTRVRPTPAFEAQVKRLRDARDRVAAELDLDPSLLAARGVLEAMAAHRMGGEGAPPLPELRAWQAALLLPAWERP